MVNCIGRCQSDDCPFPNGLPPFELYGRIRSIGHTSSFLGVWKKETALEIARCLREHGIGCKCRGRGPRDHSKPQYSRDLRIEDATHLAIYVNFLAIYPNEERYLAVKRFEENLDSARALREQENNGITRIEALKREMELTP